MNHEFELKLQSLLDGEIGQRESRDLEARLRNDPEASALLAELRNTSTALRGNEADRTLPETREFYWSKIERAIELEQKAATRTGRPLSLAWLLRYWPQLSGATVAILLLLVGVFQFRGSSGWEDIENPLDGTGTFCFRSEPERMTLVWVGTHPTEDSEPSEAVN